MNRCIHLPCCLFSAAIKKKHISVIHTEQEKLNHVFFFYISNNMSCNNIIFILGSMKVLLNYTVQFPKSLFNRKYSHFIISVYCTENIRLRVIYKEILIKSTFTLLCHLLFIHSDNRFGTDYEHILEISRYSVCTSENPSGRIFLLQTLSSSGCNATGNKLATCWTLFNASVNIDRGTDNINSDKAEHKAISCSLLYCVHWNED